MFQFKQFARQPCNCCSVTRQSFSNRMACSFPSLMYFRTVCTFLPSFSATSAEVNILSFGCISFSFTDTKIAAKDNALQRKTLANNTQVRMPCELRPVSSFFFVYCSLQHINTIQKQRFSITLCSKSIEQDFLKC